MPRRKQDKPQHWEEDDNMKTEQLMPNTVSHREANLNSQQILDGKLKDNLKFENSAVSNTNQDVDIEEGELLSLHNIYISCFYKHLDTSELKSMHGWICRAMQVI